jgi:hypothetical protein
MSVSCHGAFDSWGGPHALVICHSICTCRALKDREANRSDRSVQGGDYRLPAFGAPQVHAQRVLLGGLEICAMLRKTASRLLERRTIQVTPFRS